MRWTQFNSLGERLENEPVAPPVGTVISFGGDSAPSGWLPCDGSEVARSAYAALDAVIGTAFGPYTNGSGGAGSTHLRLPDMRGRVAIGLGTGAGLTTRALGATGGAQTVTLSAAESGEMAHSHVVTETAHTHSVTETPHKHGIQFDFINNTDGGGFANRPTENGSGGLLYATSSTTAGFTVGSSTAGLTFSAVTAAPAASAHANTQPSVVVAFLIRV